MSSKNYINIQRRKPNSKIKLILVSQEIDIDLEWREIITQRKILIKKFSGIDADLEWKIFIQKKREWFIIEEIYLTEEQKYIETLLIQQKQSYNLKEFYMTLVDLLGDKAQSYQVDDCIFMKQRQCLINLMEKMPPDLSPYNTWDL